MKRSVLFGILGVATLTTLPTFGQGGIGFANFHNGGPYNPIVWDDTAIPPVGVRSTDGVTVTLWYAPTGQMLLPGPTVSWNSGFESIGYYGYYTVTATLYGWSAGQTWDFQLRASGFGVASQSIVWQENADIVDIGTIPAPPPGQSHNYIGFSLAIPEPSSATLAAFGGLLFLCRRKTCGL